MALLVQGWRLAPTHYVAFALCFVHWRRRSGESNNEITTIKLNKPRQNYL